jgi:hypothetical protein
MKLLPIVLLFLLTGCLFPPSTPKIYRKYYDPAMLNNDISYLPKPMSLDRKKHTQYISMAYCEKAGFEEFDRYDELTSLQLSLSQAHTFKNMNIAYGAYGVSGFIKNGLISDKEPYFFDKKKFSALGARGSVNYSINKGDFDFRAFGAEFSYSKEFGDFEAFRNAGFNKPTYYAAGNTSIFTAGFTSEVIMNVNEKRTKQVGVRGFIGKSFNTINYFGSENDNPTRNPNVDNMNIAFFAQFTPVFCVLERSQYGAQVRLGYRF